MVRGSLVAGLDLKIIGRTVLKVLKREGISAEGHATMEEFMGHAKTRRRKEKKGAMKV